MGQTPPKPVTSMPVIRRGGQDFRVGLAEMNGWRPQMEDSHVIHMGDSWGFFGVLDGHGGSACSSWIARRIEEDLDNKGLPADDAAVREMAISLDNEFLGTNQSSGSTATFVIVELPKAAGGKHTLRVANIGDSRILLGSIDGRMVEGPGTDGALTTDHKPDDTGESERIFRTGGTVKMVKGVARVNGDLAVSRAFGDRSYKTGEAGDHPVSAEPEFFTTECNADDFLLLVCDGISEGRFTNREVVELAAASLRQHGDPAKAAVDVCRRALVRRSTDNLTCMIVMLSGGKLEPEEDFLPGEFWDHLGQDRFKDTYAAMAKRGGCSLAEAVERRYDLAVQDLHALEKDCNGLVLDDCWIWAPDPNGGDEPSRSEKIKVLKDEMILFANGPPVSLAIGSKARAEWFETFVQNAANSDEVLATQREIDKLLYTTLQKPDLPKDIPQTQPAAAVSQEPAHEVTAQDSLTTPEHRSLQQPLRTVIVGELGILHSVVETHMALKWNPRLAEVAGITGQVLEDDMKDGTSLVRFLAPLRFDAWLPTEVLRNKAFINVSSDGRCVRVADIKVVQARIEEHLLLTWDDRLSSVCDTQGRVMTEDNGDGTTCVFFSRPHNFCAWLPTDALSDVTPRPIDSRQERPSVMP